MGSGGSLCGTARVLKERCPGLRVVGVDCAGSVLFGQADVPQRLQSGLGNSLHPRNLDLSVIDEAHWLSDAEAFTSTLELAREQGIFAGNTSGSVYRVMRMVAEGPGRAPAWSGSSPTGATATPTPSTAGVLVGAWARRGALRRRTAPSDRSG
ncbi:pyridoxal-phosphate dependent enzyme [Nocardiopsis sp. ARC36]